MTFADIAIPITARNVNQITRLHGLSMRDFWGKTILDLGCGKSNLQADLDERGIQANVIGVDLNAQSIRDDRRSGAPYSVAAKLGALPIANSSVDVAIATYSLPHWAASAEDVNTFFDESKRVLKVGGLLSVFPLFIDGLTTLDDMEVEEAVYRHIEKIDNSPNWISCSSDKRTLGMTALKIG